METVREETWQREMHEIGEPTKSQGPGDPIWGFYGFDEETGDKYHDTKCSNDEKDSNGENEAARAMHNEGEEQEAAMNDNMLDPDAPQTAKHTTATRHVGAKGQGTLECKMVEAKIVEVRHQEVRKKRKPKKERMSRQIQGALANTPHGVHPFIPTLNCGFLHQIFYEFSESPNACGEAHVDGGLVVEDNTANGGDLDGVLGLWYPLHDVDPH